MKRGAMYREFFNGFLVRSFFFRPETIMKRREVGYQDSEMHCYH